MFCHLKTKFKLQYLSDVHLEYKYKVPRIKKQANNLALLGDIGNPFTTKYHDFIYQASNEFEKVFLIAGNHEYWHNKSISHTNYKIMDICSKFNNVNFMNNQYYLNNNILILGSTLWSNIYKSNHLIKGDNKYINISCNELNHLYNNCINWLKKEIKNNQDKDIIILTHFVPTFKLIEDKYKTKHFKKYNDRFTTNLDYMIKKPIIAWLCGHSHSVIESNLDNAYIGINKFE